MATSLIALGDLEIYLTLTLFGFSEKLYEICV